MRSFAYVAVCVVVLHAALSVPVEKKEDKSLVTGRASMLGRFEPIVNSVVVPFLVAAGVVSLVRSVPGMVSSLPGMLGFAKRTGSYEEVPKEFYDIMQMLDNAAVRYGQPGDQRQQVAAASSQQPVYPGYQQYQQAVAQAAQAAALQQAQVQAQKQQATARHHQG